MDTTTLDKIHTLNEDHQRHLADIDVDIPALYRTFQQARQQHPGAALVAVVPPRIHAELERYGREIDRHYGAVDELMGWRPAPPTRTLPPSGGHLIGCRIEVAQNDSGQVEFRPVDGR